MAVSSEEDMWSRIPLIVILGATGSGKSKLGIELARKFNGEIISADSMQLYRGLDIVTNKVTPEERAMAPHHMIDVVDPLRRFTVVDFRNMALAEIDRINSRSHVSVVVGGTNYYIESLLWKVLVETELGTSTQSPDNMQLMWERDPQSGPKPPDKRRSSGDNPDSKRLKSPVDDSGVSSHHSTRSQVPDSIVIPISSEKSSQSCDSSSKVNESNSDKPCGDANLEINDINEDWETLSNLELHARLLAVDPASASKLHPNNRRKIIRSLQVYYTEGRTLSAVLQEQRALSGGSSLGGPLRFPRSSILWIQCDQETLDKRLDLRVDAMLEQGLVRELLDFHEKYNAERLAANLAADYTAGIFQSIGFKEFHPYLLLSAEEREAERGQSLLAKGIEGLKLVTRRYARKQLRWINNRFLRSDRQVPPVYGLDSSDPTRWHELVLEPAIQVVSALLEGKQPVSPQPLPVKSREHHYEACREFCSDCERMFVDTEQWKCHLTSKRHKRQVEKNRRKKMELN